EVLRSAYAQVASAGSPGADRRSCDEQGEIGSISRRRRLRVGSGGIAATPGPSTSTLSEPSNPCSARSRAGCLDGRSRSLVEPAAEPGPGRALIESLDECRGPRNPE